MFRAGVNRIALQALRAPAPQAARYTLNAAAQRAQLSTRTTALAERRPQAVQAALPRPVALALLRRHASTVDHIDKKAEDAAAHKKMKPHPEIVSSTSSVHPLTREVGIANPEDDIDMMAGVKSDLVRSRSDRR